MATYEVTIEGKGTYEVTSDKELTDAQAYEYALTQSKAEPKKLSAGDVAIGAITNLPKSFVGMTKDIYQAVTNPVQTAQSILDVGAGALQKALPKQVVDFVNQFDTNPEAAKRAVDTANAVGGMYAERYGSVEGLKKAIANDPVSVMADMSTLLTGGALAAPKAVAPMMRTAASYIDPLTLAAKGVAKTTSLVGENIVAPVLGLRTGAGAEPIKQAYSAGKTGGESAEAFRSNLTGSVDQTEALNVAKANLEELGRQRRETYRANMENIKGDKSVLNFDGIDKALKTATNQVAFKGQIKNQAAAEKLAEVEAKIAEWKSLDPAEFHTPEGLDALKQSIGEVYESIPFEAQRQRLVVGEVYNAVKNEINKQAPTYAKTMKAYSDAVDEIKQIEKTLSLGKKASVDTAMRKLQSLMRDNVNTNYGQRLSLAKTLEEKGGQQMMPALAGQALQSLTPRGIQGAIGVPAGFAAFSAGGLPAALLDALASSPRVVGEAAYGAGKTAKGLLDVRNALPELDYPTMFNLLYQANQPKE
jgi:hypothetical protein